MTYKVFKTFRIRTSQEEIAVQPGKLVKLNPSIAQGLLEKGKIKPYCYWLEDIVNDCQMPCFEIDTMTVISECSHFKAFWTERLKENERRYNADR